VTRTDRPRIGIDLGGTKIEGVLLAADGAQLSRKRIATPRDDYEATVEAIAGLVAELERGVASRATVGVGTPGATSRATGRIKNANSTWLNDRTLQQDLQRRLGRDVRLANDANCFALSEAVDGAGRGARIVFGAILGTGVGGGLVIEGRAIEGANAICGEWGHNPLPWPEEGERPGPRCYCGRSGCIETFLSGPGLANDHQRETGRSWTAREIVDRADSDDAATRALRRYEQRLARGLAALINVVDPDVIVLGGGLSNLQSLYERVPPLWSELVFSDRVDTRLVPPVHGDSSGVRGAAWLW